jgi:hypothetical protein
MIKYGRRKNAKEREWESALMNFLRFLTERIKYYPSLSLPNSLSLSLSLSLSHTHTHPHKFSDKKTKWSTAQAFLNDDVHYFLGAAATNVK